MGDLTGQVALITGAGSGVGRATAVALAGAGAQVVLVGRTESALQVTAEQVAALPGGSQALVAPADVTQAELVRALFHDVRARYGRLDILVNNAGGNVPDRALERLSIEDWHWQIGVNLDSAFLCVHAALPGMRAQGGGTIIHIGSNAGRRPGAKPGAAYSAAKAGMAALSAVINAEERFNGIRSTLIAPGDIDTAILDRRPAPPPPEARALALQSEDVAQCVLLVATLPARALIEELVLLPARYP